MSRPGQNFPLAQEAILHSTTKEKTGRDGEGIVVAEAGKSKTTKTIKTQFETTGRRKKRNEWTRQVSLGVKAAIAVAPKPCCYCFYFLNMSVVVM